MNSIYNLLEQHRLQHYYNKFIQLGVKDERDFLDGVTDEDLSNLGLSQVEKNHVSDMRNKIQRLRAPAGPAATFVKSMAPFCLQYLYPKCPGPKYINDMDPEQNTVEDLMLRICHNESVDSSKGVCLFTAEGMPLTDDPFFNTWSLNDRHIKNEDSIYAIFTPKENLKISPKQSPTEFPDIFGTDTVRCHIMLKGDFEVNVDLEKDTIATLKKKLSKESGIPGHVLHYRGDRGSGNTLEAYGISDGSTVFFTLSTFSQEVPDQLAFFNDDVVPSVKQTTKGISVFLSSLYIIKNKAPGVPLNSIISYTRKLTGCHPLAQSLYQLIWKNEIISTNQKIAVVEGLYLLFRELLPQPGTKRGDKIVEDDEVFEYSTYCWAYLLSQAKTDRAEHEVYAPISLKSEENTRFCDPVTIPGVPGVFERTAVLRKIKDGEKIPNCTEMVLQETSLKRATDIEKILVSVHPSSSTYHLWTSHDRVTGQNFNFQPEMTFGDVAKEVEGFPQLNVTPPLLLKDLGISDQRLVLLSKDNLGVYLGKDKCCPAKIQVYDVLSGKQKTLDIEVLAARTGDHRSEDSLATTRTPNEAIVVLIDTSSSMKENCYGNVEMAKIDAVKQLFDSFANRTMGYDFHHILALVNFDSNVRTLHTFTETLEKFKEHVHTLQASGTTKLYDALQHAAHEFDKVKKFPDCKLRILCLTDGNDVGSVNKPEEVTANLIRANIIVDSVILQTVTGQSSTSTSHILCGISSATGGFCFNPKTSRDGLKLFEEETVLSLKMRKPTKKPRATSIQITIKMYFALSRICAHDKFPEVVLPNQMNNKVTLTESALKKNIRAAKLGQMMEKDKRILEELKSLHCRPHPFFTIYPSESDITFWKIAMEGPPDTPYEKGVFELFCQFGCDYPVKPPLIRFVTPVYHCNINSVGRICHNILDRNYNAQITMREIFNAVYGLLIVPEPEDPLDSVLAEEFLTSRETYEQEARRHTEKKAMQSREDVEKALVDAVKRRLPQHLICPLTKTIFVDPVETTHGRVYERKAIEKHLKSVKYDPLGGPEEPLREADLKPASDMKKMATDYRSRQIQEKM